MGFLVEALWDRGIQAYGIDISAYAISQVRRDMIPFCRVATLTEPVDRRYDLVTCIEVVEHMTDDEARLSIQNLAAATDTILFSSSPFDLTEPTHINVKQPIAWLELFAAVGFFPDLMFDASFVTPQAMLLRRTDRALDWDVRRLFSELIRYKSALVERDNSIGQFSADLAVAREQILKLEEKSIVMASEAKQHVDALRTLDELAASVRSQVDSELAHHRDVLEKLQGDLEQVTSQNAVLVEGLEKSLSMGERIQRESRQRIDQYASESASFRRILSADIDERFNAINGKLQVMQRKVSEIEVSGLESRMQLVEILQSRIWRSLKWLGGVILRFTPGKR